MSIKYFQRTLDCDPRQLKWSVHYLTYPQMLKTAAPALDREVRRAGAWDTVEQSRFIESLFLGPDGKAIWLYDGDSVERVLDGLERLIAVDEFLHLPEFRLVGLKFFPDFEGRTFSELPPAYRRLLKASKHPVYRMRPAGPESHRLAFFRRLCPQRFAA